MANKTVKVLARITARPDKIEELRSLLLDLVKETRREKGCISYQLLHGKADPGDFVIDTHFATAHVQDAFSKAASLLAKEPDIRRYDVIE